MMSERQRDRETGGRWEDQLRGERMRPSPRLERRLERWVEATAARSSGVPIREWAPWRWAGAAAGLSMLVAALMWWSGHGSDGWPIAPGGEPRVAQILPEEYWSLEDLLADMDLVVFAHADEFIFYEWMVY